MDLEIFLGNKTKFEIIKFLLFKQEGISARELESHINCSFPAIKKQIDKLDQAGIILKNQKWNKWNLCIKSEIKPLIMDLFLYHIKSNIKKIFEQHSAVLIKCFLVDFFSKEKPKVWADMVFIHKNIEEIFLNEIKKEISHFLDNYFLDLKIVFITEKEYEKRLKFADKFILTISKYPLL